MKLFLIILLTICLILLLRIRVIAEYSQNGATVFASVGFYKYKIYPIEKKRTEKEKKPKKKKSKNDEPEEKRGGGIKKFREWLSVITDMLSVVRRRFRIDKLVLRYTAATDDAAKTAILYGAACGTVSVVLSSIGRRFRLKNKEISIDTDFNSTEHTIYVKGIISIAIWEILYITVVFGYKIIKSGILKTNKKKGGI